MRESTKRKTAIAEMSNDTRILYHHIERKLFEEKEEIVSYEELGQAIGRSLANGGMGLLRTARKNIERDYQVILSPVRGEGIKIDVDLIGSAESVQRHIGRVSRRNSRRIVNAMSGKDLTNEQRVQLNTRLSLLGAIELFSRPKAQKQIETKVRAAQSRELPIAETLKAFQAKSDEP